MMTASIRDNQLNLLASKAGYNLALRHFRTAQEFSGDVGDGFNIADALNLALESEKIQEFQVRPVVNILLAEKFGYAYKSENLISKVDSIENLAKVVGGWTNLQVVFVYTDANNGIHLLNPEDPVPWEEALPLSRDECITCYVGALSDVRSGVTEAALDDAFNLLYGGKVRSRAGYAASGNLKQFFEDGEEPAVEESAARSDVKPVEITQQPVSPPPPSGGSKKLTAKIAVNVTNELFHNGNVEAWKRIIESYKLKYPNLDVLIWYEGERINDINALFKWGKVKHGVPIMYSVSGDNPKDISKLRKYLFEGASQRFEAFLHGGPGTILKLF